jgi:Protein of unknown function (DUF1552)
MNSASQGMDERRIPSASRRRFLRGLGACLALPAFESLPAVASNARKVVPVRAAFVYFPNGAIPGSWWPAAEPGALALSPTLAPLEALKDWIQVCAGLDHRNAEGGKDGAGDHARANGTFLTGVRMRKSATDIHAGVSIDQVLAREIGDQTRFPSLELTADAVRKAGACDSGYSCAYQFNLSWSSPTTPMAPEGNPRLVFERLFGAGPRGERAASLLRRQAEQRSLIDFVLADANDMRRRLNPRDAEKLDQYLTGVRDIEKRIHASEKFGKTPDPDMDTPAGMPQSHGEHVQLMFDMLALAFQTDATRVATFQMAHDGSNRSFGEIGISEGHHDLSHHQNREEWVKKVATIDKWYVSQFARFLKKLDGVKEEDGKSLLHHSMIVYGGGNADGNRHTHTNLPVVLAGEGGGSLTPGRFVKHGGKPMTNLFLSIADRMGVKNLERFGDSTGRLSDV